MAPRIFTPEVQKKTLVVRFGGGPLNHKSGEFEYDATEPPPSEYEHEGHLYCPLSTGSPVWLLHETVTLKNGPQDGDTVLVPHNDPKLTGDEDEHNSTWLLGLPYWPKKPGSKTWYYVKPKPEPEE